VLPLTDWQAVMRLTHPPAVAPPPSCSPHLPTGKRMHWAIPSGLQLLATTAQTAPSHSMPRATTGAATRLAILKSYVLAL
jgi:hypothetical protein